MSGLHFLLLAYTWWQIVSFFLHVCIVHSSLAVAKKHKISLKKKKKKLSQHASHSLRFVCNFRILKHNNDYGLDIGYSIHFMALYGSKWQQYSKGQTWNVRGKKCQTYFLVEHFVCAETKLPLGSVAVLGKSTSKQFEND